MPRPIALKHLDELKASGDYDWIIAGARRE